MDSQGKEGPRVSLDLWDSGALMANLARLAITGAPQGPREDRASQG